MMFNGAVDGGRRTICGTEFAIRRFINLVLSFKTEEFAVQFLSNFREWVSFRLDGKCHGHRVELPFWCHSRFCP